ncbi:MAG: autotransporter-associated beta strand repeat-containing protein [Verrucomicrobiia bacterium]
MININGYWGLVPAWGNVAATGVINLLSGGLISTPAVRTNTPNAANTINFDGGTLQANGNHAAFMQGLRGAFIYDGGATIDASNYYITVTQPLLAPTGFGITNITLVSGGSGYSAAPYVRISGGGGSGATAFAQVDLLTGSVTNIFISNPGINYTSAPTIELIGYANAALALVGVPAVVGEAQLGTNVSGGLTKRGYGALALMGTNSYTGPTVVEAGSLVVASSYAIGTNTLTLNAGSSIGSAYAMDQGFLDWLSGRVGADVAAVALGTGSSNVLAFTGAHLGNTFLGAATPAPVVFAGVVTNWGDGGGNVRLGGGAGWLQYQPVIAGTTNVIIGPVGGNPLGTVELTGTNTFTSDIVVNSGFLALNGARGAAADAGLGNAANAVILTNGAGLRITNVYYWTSRAIELTAGGGQIKVDTNSTLYLSNVINQVVAGAALSKTGPGVLYAMTNIVGYSGGTFLREGTLSIDSEGQLGTNSMVKFASGILQVRGTAMTNFNTLAVDWASVNGGLDINNPANVFLLNSNMAGAGLTKLGSGLLLVDGDNSGLTNLVVAAGAVRVGNAQSLAGGMTVVVTNGSLQLSNSVTYNSLIAISGNGIGYGAFGGFNNSDGALRNVSGNNTNLGTVWVTGAARINADEGTTLTLDTVNADFNLYNNALTVAGYGDVFITNSFYGGYFGQGTLIKSGYGKLTLVGKNDPWSMSMGSLTINSGTLNLDLSNSGGIGSNVLRPTTALTMGLFARANTTGGTLNILGPTSGVLTQQFNGLTLLSGNNTIAVSNNTGTMIVNLNGITRVTGSGIINFANIGGAQITTTRTNDNTGILGPWATFGGTDWAAVSNIWGLAPLTAPNLVITNFTAYTPPTGVLFADNSNANMQVTGSGGARYGLMGWTNSVNTLRANETIWNMITNNSKTLRLGQFGGILLPSTSGGLAIGELANDGYLTAGGANNQAGEMVLINNSGNALTINSAVTNNGSGAVTVTVAGTGTVDFNGRTWITGALNANGGTVNINGTTNGMGSLAVRAGTVNINGASSFTNTPFTHSIVDSGVLNINAPTMFGLAATTALPTGTMPTNYLLVANSTLSRAVVNVATDVTAYLMQAGVGAYSAGAIYQSGGTLAVSPRTSTATFGLGNGAGSYGYYNMSAGMWTNGSQFRVASSGLGAVGVFDQFGGLVARPTEWTILGIGGDYQYALANIQGGLFYGPNAANGIALNFDGNYKMSVLNVGGSGTVISTNGGIELSRVWGMGNTAVVNLNAGGRILVNNIRATTPGVLGQSVFNFDGGTLEAFASTPTFMQGLSSALIYDGGAVIDSGNNTITVAQNLLGAGGLGLTNIAIANGGRGYIGAPGVVISGGAGTGATAYAQIDLASGTVTNIVISSTGSGYLPTDALNVYLVGGGFVEAATLGTFSFGQNAADGGLTKSGSGTLALTGTNTYVGPTTISAGTLQIGANNAMVWLNTSAITNNGVLMFSHNNYLGVDNNISGGGSLGMIGSGVLILNGANSYSGGTAITNGFVRFETLGALPGSGNITLGTAGAVALNVADLAANLIPRIGNITTSAGMLALLPVNAGESFDFNGGGWANLILGGGSNVAYTGGYTPYQSGGVNYYRLGAVTNATFTFTNEISDLFNGGSSAVLEVNKGGQVLSGTVALRPDVTNSFSGNIFIGGGALNITNDNALGAAPATATTNITLMNFGGLQFGGDMTLDAKRNIYIASSGGTLDAVAGVTAVVGGVVTNGTLQKSGLGTVILGNNAAVNVISNLLVNQGTLVLSNRVQAKDIFLNGNGVLAVKAETTGTNVQVGLTAGSRAVLSVATNLTVNNVIGLRVGMAPGAAGAIYQSGGMVNLGTGDMGDNQFNLGNASGGYGYYRLDNGTLNSGRVQIGWNGGYGVFEQFGGTLTNSGWFFVNRGGVAGVMNLFGGQILAGNGSPVVLNYSGIPGLAVLNVGGSGVANFAVNGGQQPMGFDRQIASGYTSVVNLLSGGTMIVNAMTSGMAGVSVFNFDGGLLKAGTGTTRGSMFMQNFSSGKLVGMIYDQGAFIDSDTNNIAISVSLQGASGYGLTNVALTSGGSGYIGAPVVQISGGMGTGATAIAQIDLDPTSLTYQQITNILITSAGSGYVAGDLLQIALLGGGATQSALLGLISLGANAVDGGLTKLGSGMLTLAGTNTYMGGTFLNAGTLSISNEWNIAGPTSAITFNGGLLQIAGMTLNNIDSHAVNWSTFNGGFDIASVSNGFFVTNAISGAGSFTKLGSGTLWLTGTNSYSGGTFVGGAGVLAFNTLSNLGGDTASITILAASGVPVISPAFTIDNNGLGKIVPTTNTFVLALRGDNGNDLNFSAYGSGFLGALTNTTVNYTGILTGTTNAINLGGGGGTLLFNNQIIGDTRNLVGSSTNLVIGMVGGLGGTVVTTNNHFYLGNTVINASNTLQVGDGGASGSLGSAGRIVNYGTLVYDRSDTYLLTNAMLGNGVLVQNGSGTLVLGSNYFAGAGFIANAGTTIFSNSYLRNALTLSNGATVVVMGDSQGLMGDYYSGGSAIQSPLPNAFVTLAAQTPLLVANSIAAGTNFDFGFGAQFPPPLNYGTAVNFQSRYQGMFNAPTNGVYTFVNNSDDAVTIYIDGNPVINNASGSVEVAGKVALTAGQHSIVIFFQQGGGGYRLWEGVIMPGSVGQQRLANSMLTPAYTIGSLGGDAGTSLMLSNYVSIIQTNDATFAGVISGQGGIIKNGNSMLFLTGTNTYSGGTFLQMGRLAISDDANISGASAPLQFNGGILQVAGTTLTNLDSHPVNWSSFNGGFDISNAGSVFTVTNAIGGLAMSKWGLGTLVLNGAMSNSNGVSVNAGLLQLNASNTYIGNTIINGGTLQMGNAAALGAETNTVTINAGTLDLNGNNLVVAALAGGGLGAITDSKIASGVSTLSIGDRAGSGTWGGVIQDGYKRQLALTITSGMTLTMTNRNTYSGDTRVDAGALIGLGGGTLILAGKDGAISDSTNIVLVDGGTLILTNTIAVIGFNNNRLNDNAVIRMNDANLMLMNDGGNTNFSRTLGTVILEGGNNSIYIRESGGLSTNIQTITSFSRGSIGAVLDVKSVGLNSQIGTGMSNVLRFATAPTLVNGILPWATINQTNFATYNSGTINSLSNYTAYQTAASGWSSTDNVRQNVGFTATTNMTINSLNMHLLSANATVNMGGQTLTINSGGLLFGGTNVIVGSFVGAGYGTVLSSGYLTAGNGLAATTLIFRVFQPAVTNYMIISDNSAGVVSLVKAGGGALVMDATSTNNYTGGTYLDNGSLYIYDDKNLGAAGTVLTMNGAELRVGADLTFDNRTVWSRAGDAAFNIDAGITLTATNEIFGTGALTKYGLGTMVLGTNNTYAGGTLISNGTLYISADSALGAAGSEIVFAGGGALRMTNMLALVNRAVTLGTGGGQLNVDAGTTLTVSNVISGVGALTKIGPGGLMLTGNNLHTGGTTNAAGVITMAGDNVFGSGTLSLAGGNLIISGNRTLTNAFMVQNNAVIDTASGDLTITGPGTTAAGNSPVLGVTNGAGALTVAGGGTLTLANTMRYAGGTYVAAGTLVLSNNAALNSGLIISNGATVVAMGGAGLVGEYYDNKGVGIPSLTSLTAVNNRYASSNASLLYVSPATAAGGWNMGSSIPAFPGGFTNNNHETRWQGQLTVSASGSYLFGTVNADDRAEIYIDGIQVLGGGNGAVGTRINLTSGPHSIVVRHGQGGGGRTLSIQITDPSGAMVELPYAMLSSGPAIYSLAGEAGSTLVLSNGSMMVVQTNDTTFAGLITGAGGLNKQGTGTLVLSGANDYAGGSILGAGRLSVTNEVNLGAAGSTLTFAGGLLQVVGVDMTNIASHTVNWSSFNGGFDIADGANVFTVTNAITGPGTVSKSGSGTLVLTGNNTFSTGGGVTINAGTVQVGNVSALGYLGTLTVNGGVLDLNGNNAYVGGLAGLGGRITDDSAGSGISILNVTNVAGNTVFGGQIADGASRKLSFTLGTPTMMTGAIGTLIFTNNNTYSGATFIQGGALALSNAAGALSSTTNIFIRQGASLVLANTSAQNNGNRVNNAAIITLRGGTLIFTNDGSVAAYSETLGNLVSERAGSTVQVREAAAGGSSTLAFGNLIREGGGINFTSGVFGTALNRITFLNGVAMRTNNILGGWITVNGTDWATYDPGNSVLSNFTAYTLNGLPTAWGATVNAKVTTNFTLPASADRSLYSLNLGMTNRGGAINILNLGNNRLTIVSGGLLFSSNSWTDIRQGRLTAGTLNQESELLLHAYNTLTVTNYIMAVIENNGTGALTLNKLGTGIVVLGNVTNTYTGGTFIGDGVLQLGGDFGIGASEAMTAIGGTNVIRGLGTGEVTVRSGGELRFGGNTVGSGNYLTNAVTLGGGKITVVSGQHHLSGPITLDSLTNSTLEARVPGRQLTLDGVVSGAGGLRIIGASSAVILTNGLNTYSGGTFVDGGVLLLGNTNNTATDIAGVNGALGTDALIATNVSGGVGAAYPIDQDFLNVISARAVGDVYNIVMGASSSSDLDFRGVASLTNSYLAAVPGSGLVNPSSGDLIYSNAVTYTGNLTPANNTYRFNGAFGASGVLVIGSVLTNAANGDVNSVMIGNAGIVLLTNNNLYTGWTFITNGGTLMLGSNTTTGSLGLGAVTNFGSVVFSHTNTAAFTFTNTTQFFGTGTLIKNNSNVLQLAGVSTSYAGAITVNMGTLQAGADKAFGNGTGVMTLNSNSVLDLNGYTEWVGGLSGNSMGAQVTDNSGMGGYNILFISNASTVVYAGSINDGANTKLSLFKLGGALQAFTGTNNYTGGTIIGGGVLRAVYGLGLPYAGNLMISNGSFETSYYFTNALGSGSGQVQLPYYTNGLAMNNWSPAGFSVVGTNIVVNLGGNAAPLIWNSPYFSQGALILGDSTANATLVLSNALDLNGGMRPIYVNAGVAVLGGGMTNSVAANSGFYKYGGGVLVLQTTNYFTGAVTVQNGTLYINSDANLGNGGQTLTFSATAGQGTPILRVTNNVTFNNRPVVINSNTTFLIDINSKLTISNTISSGGGVTFTKSGLGTLAFTTNQNPNYNLRTIISQGTLMLGTTNNLKVGTGLFDLSSTLGAIGTTNALDQGFLNWAALRSFTNLPNVGIQGAIVLGANSANNLNFSLATATNNWTNTLANRPLTNAFLGASEGTWTYSGSLSSWTNSGVGRRIFGASGTNVLLLGGGNGVLDYAPVVGSGTNVIIGPSNAFGVVQFTNYNAGMTFTVAVIGGTFRAATNIGLPSTANLMLTGGVFEVLGGGTLLNTLGTGGGQIRFGTGAAGGFSTYGGPLTVNLGGAGAVLQWGSADFAPSLLMFGTNTTDGPITMMNGLNVNNANRAIYVGDQGLLMVGNITNSGTTSVEFQKWGTGTLILSNITTVGWPRFRSGGTIVENGAYMMTTNLLVGELQNDVASLLLRGTASITNRGNFFIGNGGIGVVTNQDTAIITTRQLTMGNTASGMGVLQMNGGTLKQEAGNNGAWLVGSAAASYGYVNLASGTINLASGSFVVGSSGMGQFDMTGGLFTNGNTWVYAGDGNGSFGVINVLGGSFNQVGGQRLMMANQNGSAGIITVAGSGVINALMGVRFNNFSAGGQGVFNLNEGGVLNTPLIEQTLAGVSSFNFDGGVLRPSASSATFMRGIADAIVYDGGAIIDTTNFNITIAQNLEAPAGNGIVNIPVAYGGQGYMGPPLVRIIGDGTNATAYAQIDPVTGSVTNIVVTSAGTGYTKTPFVMLVGGTPTNGFAAVAGTPTLAANAGGGLTKLGTGTLTLAGTNTYTGGTFLNAGTLSITNDWNLGDAAGALTFNGGILQVAGTTMTNMGSRTVNWSTFNGGFDIADLFNVFTVTNAIGGTSGLTKAGVGVLALNGQNTFAGTVYINGGALRATEGVGLPLGTNLVLNGGAFETGVDFTRALGVTNNTVSLAGAAGISAFGGPVNVTFAGAPATLTWGMPNFNPTSLILNAPSADSTLTFGHGLNLAGATRTISVGAATAVVANAIVNGPALVKVGSGTLLLSGANTFTNTFINEGTLKVGADNTLWTNGMVSFGDVTNAPNGSGSLDLSDFSQTIGRLAVQTTNRLATNSIVIGAGQQLTVLGNVQVGVNATSGPQTTNGGFANLVMSGAGSFVVTGTSFRISTSDNITNGIRALLDMSGLATANINLGTGGSFLLGDLNPSPGGSGDDSSMLMLASNTTITAGNLDLGPGSRAVGLQVMKLGDGTNTINVNFFNIGSPTLGSARDGATLMFNSATGELVVRAANGVGRTTFYVGAGNVGTAAAMSNTVDFTGHNVDLLLGMLNVGEQSRQGNSTSKFSFDTGVLDANGMRIGNRPAGQGRTDAGFAGIVNIGGGVVTIGGSGVVMGTSYGTNYGTNMAVLNITGGAVTVGSNIVMLTQNSRTSVVYSTINLSGGSLTVLSNIITGTSVANATTHVATINLTGGQLDMTGHTIGGAAAANFIDVLNFQSGTLQNVAQINNGAALMKTNAGVLTLAGSNSYTGATVVTNGTLVLAGYSTGFGRLGVTGATVSVTTGTGFYNNVSVGGNGVVDLGIGGVLRFTNSFLNGLGATLAMNGGAVTNSAATEVLTNLSSILGLGTISALVDNRAGAFITATDGLLRLTAGFANATNAGTLRASGLGANLQIDKPFNNAGSILVNNANFTMLGSSNLVGGYVLFTNHAQGVINGTYWNYGTTLVFQTSTLTVNGNLLNRPGGLININNSRLNVRGRMFNSGTMIFDPISPGTNYYGAAGLFSLDTTLNSDINTATAITGEAGVWPGYPQGWPLWDNFSTNRNGTVLNGEYVFFTNAADNILNHDVEVASIRKSESVMAVNNFMFESFYVGDPLINSNGYVRLKDEFNNQNGNQDYPDPLNAPPTPNTVPWPQTEIFAASNLIVALSGSVLDWNNRSGFAYNLSNNGTMLWTNAGNAAGTVIRLDVVNTFTNQGTIMISNGTALQFSNAFLNGSSWGVLALFNGGVLTNFAVGSVLTNAGTIYGDGLVVPAVANEAGATVAANVGKLLLGGGLTSNVNNGTLGTTNAGTLAVDNAALTNTSSGRIGLMGGVFTLTGSGSNVVNQGVMMGYGTNAVVIDNRSSGSVIATGGVLRLTGGLTNNVGAASNAGLLAALGASAQLDVTRAFTNLGSILLNNATASFTAPRVDNAGQILGNGAFNAVLNNAAGGVVSNDGTGGTLTFNSAVNNAGNMVALNNSGLAFAQAVNNAAGALIGVANGGVATFNAAVTNAAGGVLGMRNQGTLIFNAGLTNHGVLGFDVALNPSTAIITGTLLLGSSGTISMTHNNDTLVMRGNFVNGSTDTNGFNMRDGTMVFGGTAAGVTNTFEVAGTNKGATITGFVNNMALGTLNITNHIEFVNNINNGGGLGTNESLYLDVLHLFNGATLKLSQLTIYVGMEFIYEDSNGTQRYSLGQGGVIDQGFATSHNMVNLFLDGGGQLVFVPEPSSCALMSLGLAALAGWRRRRTVLKR